MVSGMREFLREQINPTPVEDEVPWSRRLANYAREVRQAHQEIADRREAEAAEAAKPKPQSLVEELRGLIGQPTHTWKDVREELDRRVEERRQRSVVEALKEALGQQEQSDVPGLNDQRLLQIAAGTPDMPHSTRESVAAILRGHWDRQER